MPPHFVESFSTLGFSAVPAKWGYWTQRLKAVWREQTSTGRSWPWAMTWSAQDCTRFKIGKNNFSVPTSGSNNWNNFSIQNMRSISKQKSPQAINIWAEDGATPSNSWIKLRGQRSKSYGYPELVRWWRLSYITHTLYNYTKKGMWTILCATYHIYTYSYIYITTLIK